jgi:hypothetical protein
LGVVERVLVQNPDAPVAAVVHLVVEAVQAKVWRVGLQDQVTGIGAAKQNLAAWGQF